MKIMGFFSLNSLGNIHIQRQKPITDFFFFFFFVYEDYLMVIIKKANKASYILYLGRYNLLKTKCPVVNKISRPLWNL